MSHPGLLISVWKVPWRIWNKQEPMPNAFWNPLPTWSFIRSRTFQFVLGSSMPRWRDFSTSKSLIAFEIFSFRLTAFGFWRNRLTEQLSHHPNSQCSHVFGIFVDDSSNIHRKSHWTIVMHLFLFVLLLELDRDHTHNHISITFFFMTNSLYVFPF